MSRLRVLVASSEVYGYAKVGGLGDVAYSLPRALKRLGIDARIIAPMHKPRGRIIKEIDVTMGDKKIKAQIRLSRIGDVPLYLIEGGGYFPRENVYGYVDDFERYVFFSKAIVEFIKNYNTWRPDILHANDWHTGLVAAFVKQEGLNVKTIFTIHNLGYQGDVESSYSPILNLQKDVLEKIIHNGRINPIKSGLIFSDIVNTVSKTYAKEIQTPEFGFGLDNVLKSIKDKLFGILNGIDYNVWNPAKDKFIYVKYNVKSLEKKIENKKMLAKELGFKYKESIPLVGIVSRLAYQKGIDVFLQAIESFLEQKSLQLVVLGTGEKNIEDMAKRLAESYPNDVAIALRYDEVLAHKIYAASDIFAVPSRYEPCGLTQMIAMRYGSVPIVRNTGGLADTVIDVEEDPNKARGFKFQKMDVEEVISTIKRALNTYYNDKKLWTTLQKNGMTADFSWKHSAKEYLRLYKKALGI